MSVKKILMLTAAAGVAFGSVAFAGGPDMQHGPMCDAVSLMNGFYVGIGPSYTFVDAKAKTDSGDTTNVAASGFGGQVYAGYDMLTMGKMYLGLNGFFGMYGVSGTDSTNAEHVKGKLRYSFGGTLEPGYAVASNLNVFGRVGYGGLRLRYEDNNSGTINKTHGAWIVGLGSEFGVTPNFGVRTTYTYYYGSKKKVDANLTGFDSVRPRIGEFLVGLSYHF